MKANIAYFRKVALSFKDVEEMPHFHLASIRVKKKIFATLWENENKGMLKLSLNDQSVFCAFDVKDFYPVPGLWGKQGATFVNLGKVRKGLMKDVLQCAFQRILEKSSNTRQGKLRI